MKTSFLLHPLSFFLIYLASWTNREKLKVIELFVRSIHEECLDRQIFFGEPMLRETSHSYVEHYHAKRNHQGLDNKLIDPIDDIGKTDGEIICRKRLGGMLKFIIVRRPEDSTLRSQQPALAAARSTKNTTFRRLAPTKGVAKLSGFG